MKFLHCADVHLDMPFSTPGFTTEKACRRRQDIKDVFKRIIDISKEKEVDIVLISGDLYEHEYVNKSTITFVNDSFRDLGHIKVFIVPGNHDPYITNSFYKNYAWADNVTILSKDNPYILLEDLKTCIYGIGFRNFYEDKSLIYDFGPVNTQYINLLLIHGTVDMNFKKSMYNPMSSENLLGLGMDYIALGHFHNRIEDMGGHGLIFNPGSPEPLGFDEGGDHGIFVGSLELGEDGEKKLQVEFLKTNIRQYDSIDIGIDGCSSDQQVTDKILKSVNSSKTENLLLSITLKGYVDKDYKVKRDVILKNIKDRFFYTKIKDETCPDYNFDEITAEQSIKGVFARKVFSLMEKSSDGYEKRILQKALYYGLEALEHGRVRITEE